MKQHYRGKTPRLASFNLVLMEFGDFAMERRIHGVKRRADQTPSDLKPSLEVRDHS